jgi:hypothetical protein
VPAEYRLDLPLRLVRTHEWGVLTDDDLRDLYEQIRTDPAFDPSFRQLCDLRGVTQITTSVETLRSLAQNHVFMSGSRRAFVVGRAVDFGLARLFQTYSEAEGQAVEVFRDMNDAERWLGLEDSPYKNK